MTEKVHADSNIGVASNLEIFHPPLTNVQIIGNATEVVYPVSSITNNGTIRFEIKGLPNYYIDMDEINLYIKFRVLKADKTTMADDTYTLPVANVMHSMFSQVDCYIQKKLVTKTNNLYHYLSYFEDVLDTSSGKQISQNLAGFYPDRRGSFHDLDSAATIKKNENAQKRLEMCSKSDYKWLTGKLHIPLFKTERLIVNNVSIDLELTRSKNAFALINMIPLVGRQTQPEFMIDISEAFLKVRRFKLADAVLNSQNQVLKTYTSAKFPFKAVEMKAFSFGTGLQHINLENLSTGQLPSKIILGMVKSDAFNGTYKTNPYYFETFNLNKIALYVNGDQYPTENIEPDYDTKKNNYVTAYRFFLDQSGLYNSDNNELIDYYGYANGYNIYVFDITPDLSSNAEHYSALQNGNIRGEIKFATALTQSITCVVYLLYENLLEVDENRAVRLDTEI